MRLKKTITDWIDETTGQSVVKSIYEILKDKSSVSEAYYAARPFVCMIMSVAYDMGFEKGLFEKGLESNQENSDILSFQSREALQIEKIRAAKQIVRHMDGIKKACVERGLYLEFSEDMASAYKTALKFLEGQLKEEASIQVNVKAPE